MRVYINGELFSEALGKSKYCCDDSYAISLISLLSDTSLCYHLLCLNLPQSTATVLDVTLPFFTLTTISYELLSPLILISVKLIVKTS